MKKRSAMAIAAVLVAALLAAGTVVSFSLSGATAAAQDGTEPVVLTKHRTVTVHRKAEAGRTQAVTLPAAGAVTASFSEDDDHGSDDDEHGAEHEDEDHASEGIDDDGSHSSGDDD